MSRGIIAKSRCCQSQLEGEPIRKHGSRIREYDIYYMLEFKADLEGKFIGVVI